MCYLIAASGKFGKKFQRLDMLRHSDLVESNSALYYLDHP